MAQTTSIRRRRSWPAALVVLLIVLAGLWAGAWYYGSGILERTIDGWKAREAQAGIDAAAWAHPRAVVDRERGWSGAGGGGDPFGRWIRAEVVVSDVRVVL